MMSLKEFKKVVIDTNNVIGGSNNDCTDKETSYGMYYSCMPQDNTGDDSCIDYHYGDYEND